MDFYEYLTKAREVEGYYITKLNGEEFEIPKKFKLIKILGSGSFGIVVEAFNRETGEKVAIKKCKNVFPRLRTIKGKDYEIDRRIPYQNQNDQKWILRNLFSLIYLGGHPNIITMKDIFLPKTFEDFGDVYYVMELMKCDLKTIIESDERIENEVVKFVVYQILDALKYTESRQFLHCDLKPENILVDEDCVLKLDDFGPSVSLYPVSNDYGTSFVVSRWYLSPEFLLCNKKMSTPPISMDMWSLGCIFAELLGERRVLFQGANPVDQLQKILAFTGTPTRKEIHETCDNREARRFLRHFKGLKKVDVSKAFPNEDPLALDLLSKLLRFSPCDRITPTEALQHKYFENYVREEKNYVEFRQLDDVEYLKAELSLNLIFPGTDGTGKDKGKMEMKKLCFNMIVKYHKMLRLKRQDPDEKERMEYIWDKLQLLDDVFHDVQRVSFRMGDGNIFRIYRSLL